MVGAAMPGRTLPGALTGLRSKPTQFIPFGTLGPQGPKRVHCNRRLHVTVRAAVTVAAPPGLVTKPWAGTPEQVQALQEVAQRMASCPFGIPDQTTQQWFLRDRNFDVDETVDKLNKLMSWRSEFRPDHLSYVDVAAEAATGKAYLHDKVDLSGRPVIVVRARLHLTGERPLEESKQYCAFLLESALAAMPPGTETILGIFDLRGFGHRNADLGFVRFLVDVFFLYYPKRLGQVLLVDAPWGFEPGWQLVKPWLQKYAALVRFVSTKEVAEQYFTPETVPSDFTGSHMP